MYAASTMGRDEERCGTGITRLAVVNYKRRLVRVSIPYPLNFAQKRAVSARGERRMGLMEDAHVGGGRDGEGAALSLREEVGLPLRGGRGNPARMSDV